MGERILCCRTHLESPRVSFLLPVTSPTHHNQPWPEEGHSLLSSMEGCSMCMVCNPQATLFLWLGAALLSLTWEHEGRETDGLVTPETSERKQKTHSVHPYSMQMLVSSKILINLVWMASSKFHFVCVCIPKWELGLSWASFSFNESFGNTPRHSVQISHTWFKSVRLKSVQHRKGNGRTQKFHPAISTGMEESLNDYKPSPHRTPKPWTSPVLLELKECFCCWNQALLVNSNWGSSTWLNCRLLWKQAWMERININCIFYG